MTLGVRSAILLGTFVLVTFGVGRAQDDVSASRATRRIVARFDARLPVELSGPGAALLNRQATVFDLREPDLSIDGRSEWRFFGYQNELGTGPQDEYQPLRNRFDTARREIKPARLLVPRGCGIAAILDLRGDGAAPVQRPDRAFGPLQIMARGTFVGWSALTIDVVALDIEMKILPDHLKRGELRALLAEHRVATLRLTGDPDRGVARGAFEPPKEAKALLAVVRSEVDWQGTLERLDVWRAGEFERRAFLREVAPDGSFLITADDTMRHARFLPVNTTLKTRDSIDVPAGSELLFRAGCVDAARVGLTIEAQVEGAEPVEIYRRELDAASWLTSEADERVDLRAFAGKRVRFAINSNTPEVGSRGVALLIAPRIEGAVSRDSAPSSDRLLILCDGLELEHVRASDDPCVPGRLLRGLAPRFGATLDAAERELACDGSDTAAVLEVAGGAAADGIPFATRFADSGCRVIAIGDDDATLLSLGFDEHVRLDPACGGGGLDRALDRIARSSDLPLLLVVRTRALTADAVRPEVVAKWIPSTLEARLTSLESGVADVLRAWIDRGRFDASSLRLIGLPSPRSPGRSRAFFIDRPR